MKKIAIFVSGDGLQARRLADAVENDPRFSIDIIFTDAAGAQTYSRFADLDVPFSGVTPDELALRQEALAERLADNGIDVIATDNFSAPMPPAISSRWEGRILNLQAIPDSGTSEPEDDSAQQRMMLSALERITHADPLPGKTVDEEWAEALKLHFDPSAVPPPVPPVAASASSRPQPQPCMQQPGMQPQFGMQQPQQQPDSRPPMPQNYMLWAIITMVVCCIAAGIVAVVYSAQVSSRYYAGDYAGAEKASERAQLWIIISIVVGVVTNAIMLPLTFF